MVSRTPLRILLLVVIDVSADGRKVLLAIKTIGSESAEARRRVLDGPIRRSARQPEFVIGDRTAGSMRRSPPCGAGCRCSSVRSTGIESCWCMRWSACPDGTGTYLGKRNSPR
jgi:hypothetical protein